MSAPLLGALYLIGLLVGLAGMVVLDLRSRLFFRRAPWRAAVVMLVGVAFFLLWDSAGVGLHIFFRGNLDLLTGLQLAPEIPLEELFFVLLLCYLTMNVYGLLSRWSRSRRSRRIESP
ncbi:MAG: lycopene cyclase domain-containing protein [Actinomycetota bacterium]|nr:lycopene cyclase domain-containing protein [Actinomycetota bacterium]